MGLKLTLKNPVSYIRAVSGLFITKESPSGLTSKDIRIIAKLMEYSTSGVITFSARKRTMDDLGLKNQNFYNAMTTLKNKGVVVNEELHRIFTSKNLTINYASDS